MSSINVTDHAHLNPVQAQRVSVQKICRSLLPGKIVIVISLKTWHIPPSLHFNVQASLFTALKLKSNSYNTARNFIAKNC